MIETPYLKALPFGFQGQFILQSTCDMLVLPNPSIVFIPVQDATGKRQASLKPEVHYNDPDYIEQNGLSKVNFTATNMTNRQLIIQFDFPKP